MYHKINSIIIIFGDCIHIIKHPIIGTIQPNSSVIREKEKKRERAAHTPALVLLEATHPQTRSYVNKLPGFDQYIRGGLRHPHRQSLS